MVRHTCTHTHACCHCPRGLRADCSTPLPPVPAELIYTERAHVRMLRVLDLVFYQKLSKEAILPPADVKNIFTNLEEILQLHGA